MLVKSFRDLRVYQDALDVSMEVFELSKAWPREEQFALTDQIRRSSRAVFANVAEAWRKRRYPRHFASKLTDADAEAAETQAWLQCAQRCGYLAEDRYRQLDARYDRIIGSRVKMRREAERWCGPSTVREDEAPYDPEG